MGKLSMDLYLENVRKKYKKSTKKEKAEILAEFCSISGYHRKHSIRVLNGKSFKYRVVKEKRGRHTIYEKESFLEPLKQIWLATDQLCGKRLKAAIPLWLPYYETIFNPLSLDIYEGLLRISAATIDRLLSDVKVHSGRGLCGTKPGKILKKHIPIKTDQWDETRPGFLEADTVAHCGTSLMGDFIWSLTLTDIYSGWTENRAVWNKGAIGVVDAITNIESNLPFDILGFDCDNGSEFLNWHLIRYFSTDKGVPRVQFTRSRPYHSDDNAHVEQKNWTHVRQTFGYERFNNFAMVELMNDLYKNELSLMNNYFLPNTKLIDKQRVDAKIIKKHDKPASPYQRLMMSSYISDEKKQFLKKTYESINPFELKIVITQKLNKIFSLILNTKRKNVL